MFPDVARGEVQITELDKKFYSTNHQMMADEPTSYSDSNLGPSPYDLLLMSLGACISITLRMYAAHKNISLDDRIVTLLHERTYVDDCHACENDSVVIEHIHWYIYLKGDLTEEQRQKLLNITDRCPIHKTLDSNPVIKTELAPVKKS